ncbi:MAG: glucose-1-phosphate adenylyltransferase [Gammaproteobacteria bacterium]|jgi:glucose-1-phosphate adenylyltransferase
MKQNILEKTFSIVLAGGHGSRLRPLTDERSKPAVPFGGKYRIIDFTLTNCLHSGLRRILVLTQYKSHSLQEHLRDGWSIFNPELNEYITPVPPQMRTGETWYAGTADAIYQNLNLLEESGAQFVIILSGDHIYRMDYATMLEFHADHGAAATVACMEVGLDEARGFGVMSVDQDGRIIAFEEKPSAPDALPQNPDRALASMGIYVFNRDLLMDELLRDNRDEDSSHDFGHDILPRLIGEQPVFAYPFGSTEGRVSQDRYWKDVGTLDAYYDANIALLDPVPSLNLYQRDWPIRSYIAQSPPARTVPGEEGYDGVIYNSSLAGGTVINGGVVRHSILSAWVRLEHASLVEDSILFDDVTVGAGAKLKRCIVDKHVRIPDGETIGYDLERDRQRFTVTGNGVVVVGRRTLFD